MNDNIVKYTFRTNDKLLKKLHYVARYEGRSANKELEFLVKRHIAEFEKQHGKITVSKA